MSCDKQIGVKNILITFTDCATGQVYGPFNHKLAAEDLPMITACNWTNTALTFGYVSRSASNAMIVMNVIRETSIPLAYYQGCAAVDIQIEYYNGLVYTLEGGNTTEPGGSDTHSVEMTVTADDIDEVLPVASSVAA